LAPLANTIELSMCGYLLYYSSISYSIGLSCVHIGCGAALTAPCGMFRSVRRRRALSRSVLR